MKPHDLFLVIGQSGAGRTTVIHVLDDQGFDTLDNVPIHLISRIVSDQLFEKPLALGVDISSKSFSASNLFKELNNWRAKSDSKVIIIFLSCKTETLLNRFSITRRPHPMTGEKSLKNSIKKELEIIGPLRDQADFIIDTSSTSPNDLRLKLGAMFSINSKQNIKILIQSFSFRKRIPHGLDMVFDCRFLKNPNWVETLKNSDGTKKDVSAYIRRDKSWAIFRDYLKGMVLHVIPAFEKEGKYYLSIGFGCTGGRHRSVFVSQFLYDELKKRKFAVELMHSNLSI